MLESTMTELSLLNGNFSDLKRIISSTESQKERERMKRTSFQFFYNKMNEKSIYETAQMTE